MTLARSAVLPAGNRLRALIRTGIAMLVMAAGVLVSQPALALCGDDICNFGETCSTCSADCCPGPAAPCGDGTCTDGSEDCSTCSFDCCPVGSCGDGALDGGEQCDDGNTADGDGCDASCMLEAQLVCGAGPDHQHSVWLRAGDASGPEVTYWENRGRPFNFATATGTTPPELIVDALNGHPVLRFEPQDGLEDPDQFGQFEDHAIIAVIVPNAAAAADGHLVAPRLGIENRLTVTPTSEVSYRNATSPTGSVTAGQAHIVTALMNTTPFALDMLLAAQVRVDGVGDPAFNVIATDYDWSPASGMEIGNDATSAAGYHGDLAELIVFKRSLSETELAEIHTYLAIKYGITIPFGDYRDAAGNLLYDHADFPVAVAGVGRSDCTDLLQEQGHSAVDDVVRVDASGSALSDGQYVLWGSNAATKTVIDMTSDLGCAGQRFGRVYRFANKGPGGAVGAVRMEVDLNGFGLDVSALNAVRLLVDGDLDFTEGATDYLGTQVASGVYEFTGVAPTDGAYFTVFACPAATCGNGLREGSEGCDDGNLDNGDGCDDSCVREAELLCGDTVQHAFWARAEDLSGLEAFGWNDVGGPHDLLTPFGLTSPGIVLGLGNGNNVLEFDGTDALGNSDFSGTFDSHTLFVTTSPTIPLLSGRTLVASGGSPPDRALTLDGTTLSYGTETIGIKPDVPGVYIARTSVTGGTDALTELFVDGVMSAGSSETVPGGYRWSANDGLYIGNNADGDGVFGGPMSDVILFRHALSEQQREIVQTYLALKFSMVMPYDSYRAPDNTALYGFDTHPSGIIGVARNDCQQLDQQQATAYDDADFLTITADALPDGGYVVIGHNGASKTTTDIASGLCNQKVLERLYRVGTGGASNVPARLTFRTADLGDLVFDTGNVLLYVDDDGDFSSGATPIAPAATGAGTHIFDVTLDHGQHLLLAAHNDVPTANDFAFTVSNSGTTAIPLTGEYTIIDGTEAEPLTSPSPNGFYFVDNPSDAILYIPSATTGNDTLAYEVCSDYDCCDVGIVSVTLDINTAPTANDDSFEVNQDTPQLLDVLANDVDGQGDTMTPTITIPPTNGSVTVQPSGQVLYTPDPGFFGSDSFQYEACDTSGECSAIKATASISVNGAPFAGPEGATVQPGSSVTITVSGNDTDPEGDALTWDTDTAPGFGSVVHLGGAQFQYTAPGAATGQTTFTYEVCDANGACSTGTVTITIDSSPNQAPIAVEDTASTPQAASLTVDVVANDTDPNAGDNLMLDSITAGPAVGSATFDPVGGTITFTPPNNYTGVVTITYQVCDDKVPALCDTADLEVTVTAGTCGDGACNGSEVCTTCPGDCGSCVCGNGAVEVGEQCDDGNTTPYDGCDENCQKYNICGAGVDPADAFWVRADWIPGADGSITFWDSIGSDYDLSAIDVTRPPRFDTATPPTYFNGHPALNAYPTSRDGMVNKTFRPTGGHALFWVDRRWITGGGIPVMDGDTDSTAGYSAFNFGNDRRFRYNSESFYDDVVPENSRPYVYGFTTTDEGGGSMTGSYHIDGVTTDSRTIPGDGSWQTTGITIADYFSSGSPSGRYYGHVAEVIVCPTEVGTTDRNAIETYLSVKYGIPIASGNLVGADGTDLWNGQGGFDAFVVGIGKQDLQGLNQIETSSWFAEWLTISVSDGTLDNNQYGLIGSNASTDAWLDASPISGYDRASEATYYFNSRGSGGHVGAIDLTINMPFPVGGYATNQFTLLHDTSNNFAGATAITASSVNSSDNSVTWSNVSIPDGRYIRFFAEFLATCSDGSLNGQETDVDCGGNCLPCDTGDDCSVDSDCLSQVCSSTCQAPTCSDGIRNGDETEVDCGGSVCADCDCVVYMAFEENTCNNLDEDCDGETDENYDDGYACTASFCNAGTAQNIPNNTLCDDANGCTQDICDPSLFPATGCGNVNDNSGQPNGTLDDGNPCTDLRCVDGATQNVIDDTNVPDDGLFCTNQTCSGGSIVTAIDASYCLHNGECVADGQPATSAPCGVCDVSKTQTGVNENAIEESFEGVHGWTFTVDHGAATGAQWQVDNYRVADGNRSLYYGKVNNCDPSDFLCDDRTYNFSERVGGSATSGFIDVPNTVSDLTFDLWANVEWGYDVVYLEINDGDGWDFVWLYAWWTSGFEEQVVSLNAYAGQTVQFRFTFDTFDELYNDYEGVYIDNLQVAAACCYTSNDCDDGDACTVDFCGEEQACRTLNTCVSGCDAKQNILLVLDYSGSMQGGDGTGQSKWQSAVDGIDAAMAQFEPLMNTGLLLFPSETDGVCGVNAMPDSGDALWDPAETPTVARSPEFWFGTSRTDLVSHLNSLTPPGGTPMSDALIRAGEIYASGHPTLNTQTDNYVLLITDGAETCGKTTAADEVLNLYNAGVETFVIGFGSGVDPDVLEAAAINGGHANDIGTAYYSASNEGEMTDAMIDILLELIGEECDGIDNDCNGVVDDDVPDVYCTVSCNGIEYPSVQVCVNGGYSECLLPSIPELCDGVDNDCDGLTDEGFTVGDTCTSSGVGACATAGTVVCNGDGSGTTCSALPGTPTTETCDGVDNDCDGAIDEAYPIGQPCDGSDDDLCANGTWSCAADGTAECVNETVSLVETCDGIDNDCDGVLDDGFNVGAACDGNDADLCAEGVLECEPTTLGVICNDNTGDNIETCNGVDDDCDGKTDEGFDVGFPCDGPDADLCLRGTKVCTADGTGTECANDEPLAVETCNGVDDDCDGLYDEPDADGCVQYYEDTDNDGYGTGPGQCLCAPVGDFTSLTNDDCDDTRDDVYPGSVEICDGVDQDCDTVVDENPETGTTPWVLDCYGGPEGTEDVGICTGGTTTCLGVAGFDPICQGEQQPEDEACDTLDNDCDGVTDEENALDCDVYYQDVDNDTYGTGPARCLCFPEGEWDNTNDLDCNDDDPLINPDAVEVCDGVDNECDTFVDEDPGDSSLKLTQTCYTGPPLTLGVGTCASGIETCDSTIGDWGPCEGEVTPTPGENCDGLDTDCDGLADDEEPGDGNPPEEHACSTDPSCQGLSCYCFNNEATGMWSCIAD